MIAQKKHLHRATEIERKKMLIQKEVKTKQILESKKHQRQTPMKPSKEKEKPREEILAYF